MHRKWDAAAPWIAPLLLCAIAVAQIAFSQLSTLSPWKGGGFGMFSTVDSPAARFLRIRLVTADQEIPVTVPDRLRATSRELCTIASSRLATELAATLAEGTWVKLRMASAVDYYRQLFRRSLQTGSRGEVLQELGRNPSADAVVDFEALNFVRMLDADEKPGADDAVLDVERVEVELWRYAFDRPSTSLRAERMLEVSSPSPDGTPRSPR